MTSRQKLFVAAGVVILLGAAAALSLANSRDRGPEVRLVEVARRDLVSTVTASGNVRARRTIDISSDISARVAELRVREGDEVEAGQVLLVLDRSQMEAARSRARAALSQAEAQASQTRASLLQAQREYDRLRALIQRDSALVSGQQLDDAETRFEVARANLQGAEFGVQQAQASLDEADDRLSKTIIRAPIGGKVTRLNVEQGETVIIGTMNNPGSLVLTISDLSVVEVVVQVDETDVPELALGDPAEIDIDAFPAIVFTGRVTEIGNSAIRPPSSAQAGQEAAIDFEVVITLDGPPVELRPDLSATAEIVTESRSDAVTVPIIALTVRDPDAEGDAKGADADGDEDDEAAQRTSDAPTRNRGATNEVEGVFVVQGGTVRFQPVVVGIAGQEYFEILSGVEAGDTVVAGPYQTIRQIRTGDPVRARESAGSGS